ncbi:MAG: type II toxin-antitoxin system Phd/YefM family antitoxin [Alphaproteobacteria bacterium]|nr:type II toxin-antitoxin system Phd/YefM family antitoxin [Alphaproteobacteria bacterium]
MATVDVHEAQTHLSRLLARAEAGEDVVIARDGRPVARLVAIRPARPRRQPGTWAGALEIADDVDDALPASWFTDLEP